MRQATVYLNGEVLLEVYLEIARLRDRDQVERYRAGSFGSTAERMIQMTLTYLDRVGQCGM